MIDEWATNPKIRLNRSESKKALQLKFVLEVESETTEGTIEKRPSTQLIWQFNPSTVASEFVADWKRLQKNALVRCQTDLDPISSKGIYQAVDLSNVKTFVPSYDRNRGSFVAAYKRKSILRGFGVPILR